MTKRDEKRAEPADAADDEALVEAAFRAGRNARLASAFGSNVDETFIISEGDRTFICAAIAAIRPTIEAAERERCAKIADDDASICARDIREARTTNNILRESRCTSEQRAALRIAVAIRGKTHD